MIPTFNLLGHDVTAYGLAASVGLIIAVIYLVREAKRVYGGDGDILLIMLIAAGGAAIGSHLLYGAIEFYHYGGIGALPPITSFSMFLHIFPHFFGGSVFYGGLIGGAIAAFIAMKKLKTPLYPALDLITPVIPLFHAFGRIGCFLSGCCFGIESNVGFIYNNSINEAANGVRRFPVQLLESGCEFALFAVLFSLYRKGKCKGRLFPIYLTTYGVTRFLDENLRGDTYRGIWNIGGANLSTSQIISIAVILAGIAMLLYKRRGQTPEPART